MTINLLQVIFYSTFKIRRKHILTANNFENQIEYNQKVRLTCGLFIGM